MEPTGTTAASRAQAEQTYRWVAGKWLDGCRSSRTRDAYQSDLVSFANWCASAGLTPLEADPEQLRRYRSACEGMGGSAATVARRLCALASFFRFARSVGAMSPDPFDGVARPVLPRASLTRELDDGEVDALLRAAESLGSKTASLVGLLMLDGLKLGEVLAIDVAALEGAPPELAVTVLRRGWPQCLALHRRTSIAIGGCLEGRSAGPLLVSGSGAQGGSRLTRFGAGYLLKQAGRHAGVPKAVTASSLRRSYAVAAVAGGSSLEDVGRRLGQHDPRTTRRYVTGHDERSSRAVRGQVSDRCGAQGG